MKRIRMFASVILVMAMMLSVFAMPAAAIDGNSAEPRVAMMPCPKCEQLTATYVRSVFEVAKEYSVYSCDMVLNTSHKHQIHHDYDVLQCYNCGRVATPTSDKVYCCYACLYITY